MSKQLKPVIRYGRPSQEAYLCLPLTPASRKAMIEAMQSAMIRNWDTCGDDFSDVAEFALAALEKMAGEK